MLFESWGNLFCCPDLVEVWTIASLTLLLCLFFPVLAESLAPGETVSVVMGIDFCDSTQVASFQLWWVPALVHFAAALCFSQLPIQRSGQKNRRRSPAARDQELIHPHFQRPTDAKHMDLGSLWGEENKGNDGFPGLPSSSLWRLWRWQPSCQTCSHWKPNPPRVCLVLN